MKRSRLLIGLGVLVAVVLVGGATWALAQDDNSFYACANRHGLLRVVASHDECLPQETPYEWNIVGPQGSPGEDGASCEECPALIADLEARVSALERWRNPKIAFLSSATYNGNLGGLAGADEKCQSLANAAGLPGEYKAWLSDHGTWAADRLTHSISPYVLVDGTIIAYDWDDLTDISLHHQIDLDESGAQITVDPYAWTGSYPGGAPTNENCNSWYDDFLYGVRGRGDRTDGTWTNYWEYLGDCEDPWHLYCFEQ